MQNTKFLERNRINKILSAVYDYPLTILEAPMGYGKTTAVKKFIEAKKLKPFWFTFPDLGNSESVFWDKLADEIMILNSQTGLALKSLGIPADAPQMEKVLHLLTDVVSGEVFLMILDNYQFEHDARLKKLIMRLALEEIDGLHILLITRDTSNIDFVELLSKGLCCIVSRQHLKFTESETWDYCRMMLGSVTDDDLSKIFEYTDGWISFIYIILLGLENGIPVGMSTTIEEMVEKTLFAPYDSEMQNFLLRLSIMDVFTAKQAEFVTDKRNAFLLLKKLKKENAFIFYDEINKTYKIHNILLDYLRLKQSFSAKELYELYSRLGDWYIKKQEFQTAYGCWNRAGQTRRILSHMNNPDNMRSKLVDFEGIDEMFNSVPREMLFCYPFAYLLYICHSFIQGKQNASLGWKERLEELQKRYEKANDIDERYRNRILGEILVIRKFIHFNHLPEMMALDKEIIRLLNGQDSYLLLREYLITFGAPQYLFLYFKEAGTFKNLANLLAEYNEIPKFANGCGTGCDSLALAEYALETGDFDKVEQNCLQAIAKAETMSQANVIFCAKFSLMRLRATQDRISDAMELLEEMRKDTERINKPLLNTAFDLCKGFLFASIGQHERIASWLQIGDMTAANYIQSFAYIYIVYGKVLMASGKYTKLEALIGQFNKQFSIFSNQLGFIYSKIFKAAAMCSLYGINSGAAILKEALNEARTDQLVMPFVESAPHITSMLKLIIQNNPDDEYLNYILTLCLNREQTIQKLSYHPIPLSQREIDILSLASEGLCRKEMAARLYISEETVKTHFKNIFQKLEVSSKVSAIKIAQERGYLQHIH